MSSWSLVSIIVQRRHHAVSNWHVLARWVICVYGVCIGTVLGTWYHIGSGVSELRYQPNQLRQCGCDGDWAVFMSRHVLEHVPRYIGSGGQSLVREIRCTRSHMGCRKPSMCSTGGWCASTDIPTGTNSIVIDMKHGHIQVVRGPEVVVRVWSPFLVDL